MITSSHRGFGISAAVARTVCIALVVLLAEGCASLADRLVNGTRLDPPYEIGGEAERIHRDLFIADLHADTLLWNRSLLERGSRGHVDIPRLREGNVGLQVFTVVTRVPLFLSLNNNRAHPDAIRILTWFQGLPDEDRRPLINRALYQGRILKESAEASDGALKLILDRNDLEELTAARSRGEPVIGALLGLEGVHALESNLGNLDRLHAAGFRLIGLNHFFDNAFSGSAHGKEKGGLTPLGRELVKRAQAAGMIIDLAHASPRAIDDVLAISDKPVISSHGGVRGTCESVRNLSDEQVRAIAASGGVIGIGLFKYATCGKELADTVRAMRYAADLVGVAHVALGSDWDGSTAVIGPSGLALLTEAMLKEGFSSEDIAAIMGGNVLRVLRAALPSGS